MVSRDELIERLVQFDNFTVKIRDPNNPLILHDITLESIQLEQFVNTMDSRDELAKKIKRGEIHPEIVIAIG